MTTTMTKAGLAVATMLIVVSVLPASEAVPPEIAIAVSADGADLENLPAYSRVERVNPSQFAPGQLRQFDVLLLDEESLDDAWDRANARQTLKNFLKDHRALVIQGGPGAFDRFSDVVSFTEGDDTPMSDNGPLPVAARAYGVYRTEGGEWDFATFEYGSDADARGRLAIDVAQWVNGLPDFEPRAGHPLSASAADPANWHVKGTSSYSYTWSPYGKVGYEATFYRALDDGSSSYDWWIVHMEQHTIPGTYLWGNQWHTSVAWLTGDQDYYYDNNQLVDWGPGSLDSTAYTQWIAYEVGMRSGVDGAPRTSTNSFGYTVEDMVVTQGSSRDNEYQYIRHEFGYESGPANGEWINMPAWAVRVDQAACLKVPFQNKAEWRDYSSSSYYTTWINSWRQFC